MMRLPAALAPWHDRLAWFDEAIAAALGPLLIAIEPLLGAPGPRLAATAHEPDGIDGLRRRGNYERLLASEWALADAMPDEFLRRAAGGEHLFLAPRQRAPRVDRELVALFDAGPDQLGAPRLVHIALWILLARRAERAVARFRWGVLQAPGATGDAQSPAMLRQLLDARTFERATPEHSQRWREHLQACVGERWTVGTDPGIAGTHAAAIRTRFAGGVEVTIATRHTRRQTQLALPADDVAARLLRGRFVLDPAPERTVVAGPRFALLGPPLFSWRGDHVAVPLVGEHAACVFHAAANPRKRQAPRRINYGGFGDLVAASVSGKRLVGIGADRDRFCLWNMGPTRAAPRPSHDAFHLVPGRREWRRCQTFDKNDGTTVVVVLDDAGNLTRWTCLRDRVDRETLSPNVVGVVRAGQERLLFATYVDAELKLFYWSVFGTARLILRSTLSRPLRCLMAGSRRRAAWQGVAAFELRVVPGESSERHWFVAPVDTQERDFQTQQVRTGAEWKIVGPVRSDSAQAIGGYGLLAIDGSRRRLLVARPDGYDTLYESPTGIATANISDDGARIAFVDDERNLVVLADDGSVQLRATSNGNG